MYRFTSIEKDREVDKLSTCDNVLQLGLIIRSLVLCVCFVNRCFSFCTFGHYVGCPSIYGFWLPLWYLQTLLNCPHRNPDLNSYNSATLSTWTIPFLSAKIIFIHCPSTFRTLVLRFPVCVSCSTSNNGTCRTFDIVAYQLMSVKATQHISPVCSNTEELKRVRGMGSMPI